MNKNLTQIKIRKSGTNFTYGNKSINTWIYNYLLKIIMGKFTTIKKYQVRQFIKQ